MYKVKHYVNHSFKKLTSTVWDYGLGKNSVMSCTTNIGCFKPHHETLKHK